MIIFDERYLKVWLNDQGDLIIEDPYESYTVIIPKIQIPHLTFCLAVKEAHDD